MLTLISGRFRGRRLAQPPAAITRPTAQRTRAAIFNILSHRPSFLLTQARVLDVFAGSGAMGLEALSRGCAHVTFVEQHREAISILKQNIAKLDVAAFCNLIQVSVQRLPQAVHPVDLIFIDPPYQENLEELTLTLLQQHGWLQPTTLLLIETAAAKRWQAPPAFDQFDERCYGAARIHFLQLKSHTGMKHL